MVPNGMGNMSNHTHMHTQTRAKPRTHTHIHTCTQPQVGPVQTNVSMSSWSDCGGRRRNTHSYSFFQCRILIDTGGSTSWQNGQCPSLAELKGSVEVWCVYECVWTSGNEWWCIVQNGLSCSSSPTCTHQHVCIATVPWAYKSTGSTVTHLMSRKLI